MRCQNCSAENPQGANFCIQCATPFPHRCQKCGFENPSEAKFCAQCAAPLDAAEPIRAESDASDGLTGERRHLTVLFCDLVGSTEIASHLDPEDWREIVAGYHRAATQAIERFGGHVAQYLGDGVMAYFGYPEAHENDAERGARAGLAVLEAVSKLNEQPACPQLSARIGIDSGAVVIGGGASKDADVFGDAPNIASRVQAAAAPDSVFITAAVHQLVSGLFVVEDCGAQRLKGIGHPIRLYRVIQASVVRRRTHGAITRGLTPFVGREDEMRLALSRWERVREGEGQLVLVVGEPGIGKSRLVEEFRARIKDDPHLWIECAGEPFFENTPFHAVTQILDQGLGWRGDESKEERLSRLERSLELAGMKLGEAVPLIAEMLSLPIPEKYPPLMFAPDQRRRRLLANLALWVLNIARLQPVVIAMEDLHWVDPSTLELTQMLVEQGATAPLMLLYTARPEFRAPWPMRAHHAQITLNRLNDRHTREMVAGVAARAALAKEVIDAVVKRIDGVPLFAEELTRLILERDGRSAASEIPATLHDSLAARLDRLGPAKEVAQIAAVLGREFSYELLQAVSPMSEGELQSALEKVADAELIYARGIPPEATYQFKHALIQDAAYEALLKSRRRELHRRVAQTITQKFATIAEAQPEVLARHWTYAGDAESAIAAWKKAGETADARGAFKEAEEGYRQGLAVLNALPESPERDARELELASALVKVLTITKGYTAPESVEATAHARALAEKSGNLAQVVLRRFGTFNTVFVSADYPSAAALADQILDLARGEGSHTSLAFAHAAQVDVRFFRGDFVGVEEHLARFSGFLEAADFRQFPGEGATAMGFAGIGAWILGHVDKARERIAQAIAFASDSHNPYDLAFARFFESYLYRFLREPQRAEAAAEQALAISEEHGFSLLRDMSLCVTGWARAQLGSAGEGVSLIRQGLAGMAEAEVRVAITDFLTSLAEAQILDGATGDALRTIDDALQANPDELFYRPETLRIRGELRLKRGDTELAGADFRDAIALARSMGAKAWELHATTSLARLLATQGRRDEARTMLADIYNWFTEGFDTADLKDAKALLDELSS